MQKLTESAIQSSYIIWLNLQYPHVADVTAAFVNGGQRTLSYGKRLKREGLKKGFPDVGIFVPRGQYHGMFIEFKGPKGKLRPEQEEKLNLLEKQDYFVKVCYDLDSAINATVRYLGGNDD